VLTIYGPGEGSFELYEDDGISLDYEAQHAHTVISHTSANGANRLIIEPAQGEYPGQPATRSYELRLYADARPSAIVVDGRDAAPWRWDGERSLAVLTLPGRSIHERMRVEWR
jgi:hypothetical protein